MASKRRNTFYKNKKQETTEISMQFATLLWKSEFKLFSANTPVAECWENFRVPGLRQDNDSHYRPTVSATRHLQKCCLDCCIHDPNSTAEDGDYGARDGRRRIDGDDFLKSFVTGDETWVPHYTRGPKRQSMQWKHASSPSAKIFKNIIVLIIIGGWLNEGGAASGRRRRKATASQPVSSTPPALQGVIQHSDLERRRPDAFTPKKPPRWFKESIGGWLNEGGAASGRRRRKATASQPVSCTPPALQGVIQHSDLERRRPDAFTPKKPPRWFKERTAAHHTFGHLPDYTDESKSAATVDREALVNMNAHMGIGGWLNEGGAASGRRRRKATASQPVSSTPPALQGVIQHSDLERRRPDAFTPKKPPRWFKERTAAHHTFGHLPDYTDETKNAATLDREALVKMNAHISMSGRLNEGGATSGRRRRKATASQPVSSTPPALQGVIQNSDLERRRPDAFTPKKPPRWFKESYPAQTQIPMPKEPEFLDYMTKRPRRKPTGYMGNRRFLSTRYEPGNTVDDEIKEPMSNSYPEQTHLPMPKEPEFLDYMTKRPRRKSTGYMGNRRFLSTRYEPGNTVDDEIKELMSNSYPEQTHLPMPEKHKFLHYMTKRPRRKPTGYMGNRRFLSRRYEPGNTVDDEIKEPMSNSYPEQTHLPMPKEPEFLDYMTKRPRRKPTGYMGNRRFLSTRYEPGNTVDDEIKEPMSNSYPEQTHLPMPKEPEFLDYMTKRPRRKSTGYMGNRRFLSTRYEPGNTVDDEIKELMSNSYPEQTHLPMPEKHKFLHYMTKRPRRKPTGYMGNRRFLSRRYEPGNTVDDEIKEPMSNSYPEQTHLPMPKEPEFLDYMTKRPRRKPTGYMGNRRFLSTGYEPGNTVDDEIKEPMSNREKRTMGVNWNDWYSPIYDRSNRWLSSLVRKLPFSFDPKELKIIYPNNKKDTLYTPYTNLKAGEKKSRPLSLTTTIKTFMRLLFVRGKAIDTPYNAGGNNRAVIPATPQGFDIPHHHNPFSGMPVSGIRSFENSFAAIPDDCHAGDPRSFPDEPLSKPSTDCAPA
ncbi:hypothetical protein AAG570_011116 [Ranatra chinensis]|uniref:Uncharacterized protein n=1 Tax=Ranatra chinensis TaxID=642074 RepID=A0ABD0YJY1_9HEMI